MIFDTFPQLFGVPLIFVVVPHVIIILRLAVVIVLPLEVSSSVLSSRLSVLIGYLSSKKIHLRPEALH